MINVPGDAHYFAECYDVMSVTCQWHSLFFLQALLCSGSSFMAWLLHLGAWLLLAGAWLLPCCLLQPHRVLSPPLSVSPASVLFCPSIMIVDLGILKLLPSFSTFTFLFETYATFTQQYNSTCFLVQYWVLPLAFSFILSPSFYYTFLFYTFLFYYLSSSIPQANLQIFVFSFALSLPFLCLCHLSSSILPALCSRFIWKFSVSSRVLCVCAF